MPQDYERSKPRHAENQQNVNPDKEKVNTNKGDDIRRSEESDVLSRRDQQQTHDYKGEAQNVNDDAGRALDDKDIDHARNKATEGLKQGRDRDEDDE